MKKNTPQKLSNRLAQYGALSIAIAGIADVNGQIIYTDVDPDSAGTTTGGDLLFDIDGDGNNDLQFRQQSSNLSVEPLTGSILGNPNGGSNSNYLYPFALSSGANISNGATDWVPGNSSFQTMNYYNCYSGSGGIYNNWCNATDKYLGLRFDIGGNTHYGWARLDVGTLPSGWILKDYAYNTVADAPITAGQTLGIADNNLSEIKIVVLNKNIALYNLPQQTNYRLFTINGQSVLDGKINNNTHVIEANTLANGIYIIELMDKVSNAVMRKKIVL